MHTEAHRKYITYCYSFIYYQKENFTYINFKGSSVVSPTIFSDRDKKN